MADAVVHRQKCRWMAPSSFGVRSATERWTYWTHVQLKCKMLICLTVLLLWACSDRLFCFAVIKEHLANSSLFITISFTVNEMLFARWRHYFPKWIKINYGMTFRFQNEVTLIYAKFGKGLFNISKVIGGKTKWPRFWPTVTHYHGGSNAAAGGYLAVLLLVT